MIEMDKIVRESLLFDFYGDLLTEKKRRVMELHNEDDLSLSEIAEEMKVSRAAVHDSLKSACRQMEAYEEKLGLISKYEERAELSEELSSIIDDLDGLDGSQEMTRLTAKLRKGIERLSKVGGE